MYACACVSEGGSSKKKDWGKDKEKNEGNNRSIGERVGEDECVEKGDWSEMERSRKVV